MLDRASPEDLMRYLDGEMSVEERERVDRQLATCRSLQEQLVPLGTLGSKIRTTLGGHLAGAAGSTRSGRWYRAISQEGLLGLIAHSVPEIGVGVAALGVAVVLGNIPAGSVISKAALTQETPSVRPCPRLSSGLAPGPPARSMESRSLYERGRRSGQKERGPE